MNEQVGFSVSRNARVHMRPIHVVSTLDMRFERWDGTVTARRRKRIHPLEVLLDMRRGCLRALDRYLAQERAIPDKEVALELRKLISGTKSRTRFRLVLVEHPDLPKSKGGRPKGKQKAGDRDKEILEAFLAARPEERKNYLTWQVVARKFGVSEKTAKRAVKRIEEAVAEKKEAARDRIEADKRRQSLKERNNAIKSYKYKRA